MNKEKLLAVAAIIEKQPATTFEDEAGFNMRSVSHACGTPSCIAGFVLAMYNCKTDLPVAKRNIDDLSWRISSATSILDITHSQAGDLFYPERKTGAYDLSPAQVAAVIRNFAETGEINWSL